MRKSPVVVALAAGCVLSWGADWLTDGGNVQRTAWQKDEKILSTDSVKGMKLLWKTKLDNEAAADALAVAGADRGTRQHSGGPERDRDRDGRLRQSLCDRRRDRRKPLEEAFHEHVDSSGERRPGRRHSVPGRHHRHAGHRSHRALRASTRSTPRPGTACCIS